MREARLRSREIESFSSAQTGSVSSGEEGEAESAEYYKIVSYSPPAGKNVNSSLQILTIQLRLNRS